MCDQELDLRFDWDEILQTCALDVQQAPDNVKDVELGTIARALGRTSSIDKLPQSILKGEEVLPELRYESCVDSITPYGCGGCGTMGITLHWLWLYNAGTQNYLMYWIK